MSSDQGRKSCRRETRNESRGSIVDSVVGSAVLIGGHRALCGGVVLRDAGKDAQSMLTFGTESECPLSFDIMKQQQRDQPDLVSKTEQIMSVDETEYVLDRYRLRLVIARRIGGFCVCGDPESQKVRWWVPKRHHETKAAEVCRICAKALSWILRTHSEMFRPCLRNIAIWPSTV